MSKTKAKAARNIFWLALITGISFFVYLWCDVYRSIPVDAAEIDNYYDILIEHDRPADALTLSLGIGEYDKLESALTRLQNAMGLGAYPISLVYGNQDKPPAFITNENGERMTITVSRKVTEKREQLSLLVHELSHVSVWSLDKASGMNCGIERASGILAGCNQEKVVDSSGFYRGQGILTLNALTDQVSLAATGGYSTQQKLFGYLKPEQFGYLLARYCAEHGILASNLAPFLEPAARKYFNIGRNYLERSGRKPLKPTQKPLGIFWCSNCGQSQSVDLSIENPEIKCSKCSIYIQTERWWDRPASLLRDCLSQFRRELLSNSRLTMQ